jgi:hypothetical protein
MLCILALRLPIRRGLYVSPATLGLSQKSASIRNTGILDDFVERFTINFQGLIHWR